jgi:hypothetical protein
MAKVRYFDAAELPAAEAWLAEASGAARVAREAAGPWCAPA